MIPTRLTLVAGGNELPGHLVADTISALTHIGWLGLATSERLARGMAILDITGALPPVIMSHDGHDHDQMMRDLVASWGAVGVAVANLPQTLAASPPSLLVMDVDSTLIPVEVIEKLAAHAGVEAEVEAITSAAMRGELDFSTSLARRVAMLGGLPVSVISEVAAEIEFSPGTAHLVDAVHAAGGAVGVVSGGFHEVVDALASRLGIDHVLANRLEVSGGLLTGRTTGEVIDGAVKARTLAEWSALHPGPTAAMGDGANDILMVQAADLGIAYCAKPALREVAAGVIPFPRLDAAAELLGV